MPRFNIELLGDKELSRRLQALPEKLERKVLRQALRAGANVALPAARQSAPVRSGRLQRSIRVRALRRRRGQLGVAVQTGRRTQLGIPPGARYYYPAAQELGFHVRGTSRRRIAGRRYMRGSFLSIEQRVLDTIRQTLSQGIEREATTP